MFGCRPLPALPPPLPLPLRLPNNFKGPLETLLKKHSVFLQEIVMFEFLKTPAIFFSFCFIVKGDWPNFDFYTF